MTVYSSVEVKLLLFLISALKVYTSATRFLRCALPGTYCLDWACWGNYCCEELVPVVKSLHSHFTLLRCSTFKPVYSGRLATVVCWRTGRICVRYFWIGLCKCNQSPVCGVWCSRDLLRMRYRRQVVNRRQHVGMKWWWVVFCVLLLAESEI